MPNSNQGGAGGGGGGGGISVNLISAIDWMNGVTSSLGGQGGAGSALGGVGMPPTSPTLDALEMYRCLVGIRDCRAFRHLPREVKAMIRRLTGETK